LAVSLHGIAQSRVNAFAHRSLSENTYALKKIELLAPAKDVECGKIAIDCGADAVYIGAPLFSARSAACNSIDDIALLVAYAHQFQARVYVALNTILFDSELDDAVRIAWDVYRAGADALIIQDLGLLECDLPPIPLHASTQLNNRTTDKVNFLQSAGFQQVVLARELNLDQIRDIASAVDVPLEYFIHGALCVSYSGQCSISQAKAGRSGNRGQCSQFCRHQYSLLDSKGKQVAKDKYLLSLKDLNLSGRIEDVLDAGVTSLKIEGRLKDALYVKNVTAHYRKELDAIFARRPDYRRASDGAVQIAFETDLAKTFNRSTSKYFLDSRPSGLVNQHSPKFVGNYIGTVLASWPGRAEVEALATLSNGDGLSYFSKSGILEGVRISSVIDNVVEFHVPVVLPQGTQLYRNVDVFFEKQLQAGTATRKIAVTLTLSELPEGFMLEAVDYTGCVANHRFVFEKQEAKNAKRTESAIVSALSKSGGTIFCVEDVRIDCSKHYFFPASVLNEARREVLDLLVNNRISAHSIAYRVIDRNVVALPFANRESTYLDNISNAKSRGFYDRHGMIVRELAYEVSPQKDEVPLMITKYCLKYELSLCPRFQNYEGREYREPFYLQDGANTFRLEFDCKNCEMHVIG